MAPHCFSIRSHNCNQLEGTGGSVVVRAAGLLERWNFKLELENNQSTTRVCTKLELEIPSQKNYSCFWNTLYFPDCLGTHEWSVRTGAFFSFSSSSAHCQ